MQQVASIEALREVKWWWWCRRLSRSTRSYSSVGANVSRSGMPGEFSGSVTTESLGTPTGGGISGS